MKITASGNCGRRTYSAGGPEIDRPAIALDLLAIRDSFASPEQINDSPITAPSKRISTLIPDYQKPLMGTIGILGISLPVLRRECQLFDSWLRRLEQLSS
ncbi:DUF4276 family protein [Cylindrospermopsis raciborskii]|uniref:DUF4276 family protein n=1 Tax=Cylindrospermopsis raciborskii TaxID=77022 RepID=UPI000C1C51FB|nr:DUF4276 family protein [Cylindrospermopsis raciborskii]MCZ2207686.1 DUF4276 family protein [Cylindrospermopsis raciborskii PAMP2011]